MPVGEAGLRLDYDPLDIITTIKANLLEINQGPEKLDISMLMEIIEKELREVSDEMLKYKKEHEETLRSYFENPPFNPDALKFKKFQTEAKSNTCNIS